MTIRIRELTIKASLSGPNEVELPPKAEELHRDNDLLQTFYEGQNNRQNTER